MKKYSYTSRIMSLVLISFLVFNSTAQWVSVTTQESYVTEKEENTEIVQIKEDGKKYNACFNPKNFEDKSQEQEIEKEVSMEKAGIRGIITDQEGNALENIRVRANNIGSEINKTTKTDSNWNYNLDLTPWEYEVSFACTNCVTDEYYFENKKEYYNNWEPVQVWKNQILNHINGELNKLDYSFLEWRVTDNFDNPMSWVKVTFNENEAETNENWYFSIKTKPTSWVVEFEYDNPNNPEKEYFVKDTTKQYRHWNSIQVWKEETKTLTDITFEKHQKPVIRGTVYEKITSLVPYEKVSYEPLENAEVSYNQAATYSDEDWEYELYVLPWEDTLDFNYPDKNTQYHIEDKNISWNEWEEIQTEKNWIYGNRETSFDLYEQDTSQVTTSETEWKEPIKISWKVTDDDGNPIENVSVSYNEQHQKTDENWKYTIKTSSKSWRLQATYPTDEISNNFYLEDTSINYNNGEKISFGQFGKEYENYDFTFTKYDYSVIEWEIQDNFNNNLSGVNIVATSDNQWNYFGETTENITTSEDWKYEIEVVPWEVDINYYYSYEGEEYYVEKEEKSHNIDLWKNTSKENNVTFEKKQLSEITWKVIDDSYDGFENVKVRFRNPEARDQNWETYIKETLTDEEWYFTIKTRPWRGELIYDATSYDNNRYYLENPKEELELKINQWEEINMQTHKKNKKQYSVIAWFVENNLGEKLPNVDVQLLDTENNVLDETTTNDVWIYYFKTKSWTYNLKAINNNQNTVEVSSYYENNISIDEAIKYSFNVEFTKLNCFFEENQVTSTENIVSQERHWAAVEKGEQRTETVYNTSYNDVELVSEWKIFHNNELVDTNWNEDYQRRYWGDARMFYYEPSGVNGFLESMYYQDMDKFSKLKDYVKNNAQQTSNELDTNINWLNIDWETSRYSYYYSEFYLDDYNQLESAVLDLDQVNDWVIAIVNGHVVGMDKIWTQVRQDGPYNYSREIKLNEDMTAEDNNVLNIWKNEIVLIHSYTHGNDMGLSWQILLK